MHTFVQVITEPTPWNAGLAAINNFGFGGANFHALLEPNSKIKPNDNLFEGIPRLVCVSGRTEEAVKKILNDVNHYFHHCDRLGRKVLSA